MRRRPVRGRDSGAPDHVVAHAEGEQGICAVAIKNHIHRIHVRRQELEGKIAGRETSLKRLGKAIDWDALAEVLMARLEYKSGAQGGRPAKDPRLMLKLCVLQSLYDLSDEEAEWQATDRMSFRCFLGLSAADTVPDARTLWIP